MRVLTEKSIDFDAKETILFKISKQNSNYLTENHVELRNKQSEEQRLQPYNSTFIKIFPCNGGCL